MATSNKDIERIYLKDIKTLRKSFNTKEHKAEGKRRIEFFKWINEGNPEQIKEMIKFSDYMLYTNAFEFITTTFIDKKGIDAITEMAKHYKNYRLVVHENGRTIGITFFIRENIDYGF